MKLRAIDGGKPADRAGWFPRRGLHVIDIENLVGAGLPTLAEIRGVQGSYAERLSFGQHDQFVVASSHKLLLEAARGWPNARYRAQSGPSGADRALLDVLWHEKVATRYTRVTIGSGDGAFTDAAWYLQNAGVWVTVVSLRRCLSGRLKAAACEVIYLDDPPSEPMAA